MQEDGEQPISASHHAHDNLTHQATYPWPSCRRWRLLGVQTPSGRRRLPGQQAAAAAPVAAAALRLARRAALLPFHPPLLRASASSAASSWPALLQWRAGPRLQEAGRPAGLLIATPA